MTTATHSTEGTAPLTEHGAVHATQVTLKYLFGIVPIVAGADKFTNFLAQWENYLHPQLVSLSHLSAASFMHIAGIIEIVAGIIVFVKPRIGAFIVMAWLIAIALQLILQGRYLDVAVRDLGLAIGGALTLARLTPFVERG